MRQRMTFTLGNVRSDTFGIFLDGSGTFRGAEADIEAVPVPGRNGELTLWNGRYYNVKVQYKCVILKQFRNMFDQFRAFLLSEVGYRKLQDSYHPQEYRMARVSGGIDISQIEWTNDAGTFTVFFDCMPQRFLVSGDNEISLTTGDTIENSTYYPSKPMLEVVGYGLITLNGIGVAIASNSATKILIDCDAEDVYDGAGNSMNSYTTLSNGKFPYLSSGSNTITYANTFTSVKIKPRWYTL